MLARLLRVLLAVWLAAAVACLLILSRSAPLLAVLGALAILLAVSAVLVLEFVLLYVVSRADPRPIAPIATTAELLSAWWGETCASARVFFWRQPFRAAQVPNQLGPPEKVSGQRGVVFVHGFFCNRGFWTPWLQRLQSRQHAFVAVTLAPIFGSIDDYVTQIETAVQQVKDASGLPPLVVCHSMGGLAVRAWLQQMKAHARVHHVVTIGTPHQGTWLARFGYSPNNRQMRQRSDWLEQLLQLEQASNALPHSPKTPFTCWYSNSDNMVFPASCATLPGADNRLVRGAGHLQLAFEPVVMDTTLAMLDARRIDASPSIREE